MDTHRRLIVARIGPGLRVSTYTPSNRSGLKHFYSAALECHIGRGKVNDLAGQGHVLHWKKKRLRDQHTTLAFATRLTLETLPPGLR